MSPLFVFSVIFIAIAVNGELYKSEETIHIETRQTFTCANNSDCYTNASAPTTLVECVDGTCFCAECFDLGSDGRCTIEFPQCYNYNIGTASCQDDRRSQLVAFLLSFFLSGVGAANFYVGQDGLAAGQLSLFIAVFLISCFAICIPCCVVCCVMGDEAKGQADLSKFELVSEIKCQYVTKVGTASSRPKVLNCFEIHTTGVTHHFAVDSVEERDEWIEIIKQSSMRQGSFKNITSKGKEHSKDVGYKTQIVGGVIRRIPIQGEVTEDSERGDLTSSGPANIGGATAICQTNDKNKSSFKKIMKAGHATKCGAVMKSWKRRFFILTEDSFGYYKSIEETEPIRSVLVSELTSVGKSKVHAGKEHLLEVATPQRIFYIQGDNEGEMSDWIKAFHAVINIRRTATTLPVTAKERTSSLNNTLDTCTSERLSPTIQEYDSSPNLSQNNTTTITTDNEQLVDNGSGEEYNTDDDDYTLGTKV